MNTSKKGKMKAKKKQTKKEINQLHSFKNKYNIL